MQCVAACSMTTLVLKKLALAHLLLLLSLLLRLPSVSLQLEVLNTLERNDPGSKRCVSISNENSNQANSLAQQQSSCVRRGAATAAHGNSQA